VLSFAKGDLKQPSTSRATRAQIPVLLDATLPCTNRLRSSSISMKRIRPQGGALPAMRNAGDPSGA